LDLSFFFVGVPFDFVGVVFIFLVFLLSFGANHQSHVLSFLGDVREGGEDWDCCEDGSDEDWEEGEEGISEGGETLRRGDETDERDSALLYESDKYEIN
jgi:hypothetical protein